jgi:hypothetical protein
MNKAAADEAPALSRNRSPVLRIDDFRAAITVAPPRADINMEMHNKICPNELKRFLRAA